MKKDLKPSTRASKSKAAQGGKGRKYFLPSYLLVRTCEALVFQFWAFWACGVLQNSGFIFRNSNRGVGLRGGFGSQGKVTNLRDFLSSENVKTPTVTDTSLRFFGTGGSKHGSQCTDSCGNSGKCSYIADSQCQPVLQVKIY